MHVIIMGCGRVGSELSNAIAGEHDVAIIDKNPEAFHAYPPGERARKVVGLGFDRDILEDAGIKDADAFVAVSSGDNSNIVSASTTTCPRSSRGSTTPAARRSTSA